MRTLLLLLALLAADRPAAAEPVVVAALSGPPPLAVVQDDGHLGGLEPDLVATLCARLEDGCTLVVATDWSDLISGLREGRYAIGFGGLSTVTLASQGTAASSPYLPLLAQHAVLAHAAGAGGPLADDGAMIGVIRGTPHALWLEAHLPL